MKSVFLSLLLIYSMAPLHRGAIITVTYDQVLLRALDGSASGQAVERGQALSVHVEEGDSRWFVITGGEYQGLKIWRGCTSNPNGELCLISRWA